VKGSLEGFANAHLRHDLDHLPPFAPALNNGALLGDGLIAVHVEVDLFSSWIAIVPEHYLFGRFHGPYPCQLDADSSSRGAFEAKVIRRSVCEALGDNRPRGRYLGLRCRTPGVICQLRKNELLKNTGERRLTKSD
jgi:hypothetical protein